MTTRAGHTWRSAAAAELARGAEEKLPSQRKHELTNSGGGPMGGSHYPSCGELALDSCARVAPMCAAPTSYK